MQKIYTFITLFVILASHCSYSQSSKNLKVKAGLNISTASGSNISDAGLRLGYHVGIGSGITLNKFWTLQPEIMYSNQGYKSGTDGNTLEYNFNYITMPLLFKFQYKAFFFSVGPQADLLFNATEVNQKTNSKEVITGSLNTAEFSLVNGIGFMANEHLGFEGRYSFSNDDSGDFVNHVLQLSAFYIFK